MQPKEIYERIQKMKRLMGPEAYISLSVSADCYHSDKGYATACVYPRGVCKSAAFVIYGNDWAELVDRLEHEWQAHALKHRADTIRKMALLIIKLTAEGNCTEAALRGSEFSAEEVAQLSAEACADADAIASNGPFEIKPVPRSNASDDYDELGAGRAGT